MKQQNYSNNEILDYIKKEYKDLKIENESALRS